MSIVKFVGMHLAVAVLILLSAPGSPSAGFVEDMAKCSSIKDNAQQQSCYKNAGKPTGKCRQFVELVSAALVAQELGTTESAVANNYKITLWAKTSAQGKHPKAGEALPGSKALLLATSGEDYKVKSQLDGSVGWVNKIQVTGVRSLDDRTFMPCDSTAESRIQTSR